MAENRLLPILRASHIIVTFIDYAQSVVIGAAIIKTPTRRTMRFAI